MIGVKHREINTFCPSVTTTTVRWNFNGLSDGLRIFPSHRRAKFVLLQVKVFTRDNHLHLTRRYAAKSDRHIWSPHKQFANCRVRFPFSNSRYLAGRREPSLTVELAKESWKWNILCFRPGGGKKKKTALIWNNEWKYLVIITAERHEAVYVRSFLIQRYMD